ncbi:MAG: rhodanese-like domain-containing protein [candidate division NC10 bacterium]|nr:rhodanese-like domain-containing protein [candidate division NC10 bacterium]
MTELRLDEPFFRIEPAEAKVLMEKGVRVVDVREPQEYAEVRIPGSTLVPLGTLIRSPREFLGEGAILFICSEGIRSAVACETAAAIGLDEVYNLEGGTQRWETEGHPIESRHGSGGVIAEGVAGAQALQLDFLQSGERLIRIHRFRYLRAVGCTMGGLILSVEESLGEVRDPSKRCTARPDHPERVPRPEFTVYAENVEAALRALIEKIRPRRAPEVFLPTE